MENKKNKKEVNYYKYATIVLVVVILFFGAVYLLGLYSNSKFNSGVSYGQQMTMKTLVNTINQNGAITIGNNVSNMTLVPLELAQQAQQQTILTIMKTVNDQGYVSLYNNQTEMILIEYQQPSVDQMINSTY